MKKLLAIFILLIFNYSCVSNAEGNTIKKDIIRMNAKYKMLENKISQDQNKVNRKLRRVDVKLLEIDKILKEAKALLYRNNADFGQDVVKMDIRVKKVEGRNEEILFKFGKLEKKFNELKEKLNDIDGNIAISGSKNSQNNSANNNNGNTKTNSNSNSNSNSNVVVTDYKKINNPIALFKLGYSYIDGKKHKSMSHTDRMNNSIDVFKHLIAKFPKHNKSNSARYWITQAYYSSGQYEKAYRSMSKFLSKYPKSKHIPQILFQMANSLKQLGIKKDSKNLFRTLIKLYPKSGYSKKAKTILKTL